MAVEAEEKEEARVVSLAVEGAAPQSFASFLIPQGRSALAGGDGTCVAARSLLALVTRLRSCGIAVCAMDVHVMLVDRDSISLQTSLAMRIAEAGADVSTTRVSAALRDALDKGRAAPAVS